ncbi:integral membrane protein Rhomboid homolog [Thermococcus kodakarensis KOD1]|uniref:Integral membrane protein Rhomboid homolog n=1 Tax=Thermococcus kodakarensis (strain ATCC BAA-918 / JCM 12380 / KOD1) TaxID=69014 RepID=Q5JH94_THEKO|nr:rhomboid family intramembrane serine protease [Thermococcus kodakarensis]WCN28799.1 rhomboid family intramembrane serine protease [Thermococcus kodakarensis]WCN31099.1 rhomboid family intramembrane serine protease [Thermococcus kodakarensis]BAD84975.1 integral membrane protein Rhomboid homolog [Thermococcus kodakarensis KOD1]
MSLEHYFHRYGRATFTLFLINVAVYVVEAVLSGGNFLSIRGSVLALLGQWNYAVLNYGYWWQLFTAMFVHVNIIHIFFNMYFLLTMGRQLERVLGPRRVVMTYIVSGLVGNVLTLFLKPPMTVSAGASGALFGIVGALITISGVVGGNMQAAMMNAFFLFLINSVLPGVNAYAHLGGLLAGIAIGYYYGKVIRRRLTWQYAYGDYW